MDDCAAFVSAGCPLPTRRCIRSPSPCAPCLARAALAERGSRSMTAASAVTVAPSAVPARLPLPAPMPRVHFPSPLSTPAAYSTVVVWFRGDLRLHDHPALTHALEEAAVVVPVYCFDPRQFGKTPFGFEKTGRYRAKFLLEAVEDLRSALQAKGADLVVRKGRPEDVLPELCRAVGARSLFYHREVSFEEQQVEESVSALLEKAHVEPKSFWSNTLYHAEDLPFHVQDMPDVYTEFREAVQREGAIRPPLPAPDALPPIQCGSSTIEMGTIPSLCDLGLSEPDPAVHGMHSFQGGEREALLRLDTYIAESRSVPDGRSVAVHLGADFSCKISPWLALGCLSPRRIHADLSARAAKAGQTSTYFELIWRDFFRFITQKYAYSRLKGNSSTSAGGQSTLAHRSNGSGISSTSRKSCSQPLAAAGAVPF